MRSVRIWFNKKNTAKYISHLDMTRCMTRAFRRTDIPLWYTEGFNPHPYLVFGLPLPLGVEADRETLDVRINDDNYPIERVVEQLNSVMVPGIEFLEIQEPKYKQTEIFMGEYTVEIPCEDGAKEFCELIKNTIDTETITFEKKTKKKTFKTINVSDHLSDFRAVYHPDKVMLYFKLPAGNDFTINPVSFCNSLFSILGKENMLHRITRNALLMKDGKEFR